MLEIHFIINKLQHILYWFLKNQLISRDNNKLLGCVLCIRQTMELCNYQDKIILSLLFDCR